MPPHISGSTAMKNTAAVLEFARDWTVAYAQDKNGWGDESLLAYICGVDMDSYEGEGDDWMPDADLTDNLTAEYTLDAMLVADFRQHARTGDTFEYALARFIFMQMSRAERRVLARSLPNVVDYKMVYLADNMRLLADTFSEFYIVEGDRLLRAVILSLRGVTAVLPVTLDAYTDKVSKDIAYEAASVEEDDRLIATLDMSRFEVSPEFAAEFMAFYEG